MRLGGFSPAPLPTLADEQKAEDELQYFQMEAAAVMSDVVLRSAVQVFGTPMETSTEFKAIAMDSAETVLHLMPTSSTSIFPSSPVSVSTFTFPSPVPVPRWSCSLVDEVSWSEGLLVSWIVLRVAEAFMPMSLHMRLCTAGWLLEVSCMAAFWKAFLEKEAGTVEVATANKEDSACERLKEGHVRWYLCIVLIANDCFLRTSS